MSEKEILLARSAMYRRQLRGDAADLRDCRAVRMVMFAGRVALFAKRAYSAIGFAMRVK
jgi:hypothetical protein